MYLPLVTPWRVAASTTDDEGRNLGAVNEPQTLQGMVRQARTVRDASGRQLAALATRNGYRVTATTLNHLAAGTYKYRPTPETIRAVAWLAGVAEEVAFKAAGEPVPGPPFADELPPGVDNLSPRSRRAAIDVLQALVAAEQKAELELRDTKQGEREDSERMLEEAPLTRTARGSRTLAQKARAHQVTDTREGATS